MFCRKCGKQLNDDALFCSACGMSLRENTILENDNTPTIKKRNKIKLAPLLVVVAVVFFVAFPLRWTIEKTIVASIAEDYFRMIKDGSDAETIDEMLVQLLYSVTESESITVFLHDQITGQDIKDIYDALMLHYSYEVKKVERIKAGHYRITVFVENINNYEVAASAWNTFSSRYKDGNLLDDLKLAKKDLNSDKSLEIAGYLTDSSNSLYNQGRQNNMIKGDHVIDVKKVGDNWEPSFKKGVESLFFDCAGIPISDDDLAIISEILQRFD